MGERERFDRIFVLCAVLFAALVGVLAATGCASAPQRQARREAREQCQVICADERGPTMTIAGPTLAPDSYYECVDACLESKGQEPL